MKLVLVLSFILFAFISNASVISRQQEDDSVALEDQTNTAQKKKSISLRGFPVAFYTPETRFAGGGVGFMRFRWKGDSLNARPSSMTIGAAYTQNNQILLYLPVDLSLKNDAFRINGELGYYKYTFFYFGIGNDNGAMQKESYQVTFPRLRFNGLMRVNESDFIGLKYGYDNFQNVRLAEGGLLETNQTFGVMGGVTSSLGLAFLSDKRDHPFYPRSGGITRVEVDVDSRWTGSDFECVKVTMDYTRYFSLTPRSVFAANANLRAATGDIPFYMMSQLGGGRRLRGQFEGQQRDRHTLQMQVEYRQEFLENWGFTAFAGLGQAVSMFNQVPSSTIHPGYGAGLRYKLDKKEHVNIRLDVGFGGGQLLPYFTISEAF